VLLKPLRNVRDFRPCLHFGSGYLWVVWEVVGVMGFLIFRALWSGVERSQIVDCQLFVACRRQI
jgi:hypothetical protein